MRYLMVNKQDSIFTLHNIYYATLKRAFKIDLFSLYSNHMIVFWSILVSVSVILGVGVWILGILYLGKKLNLTASKKTQRSQAEKAPQSTQTQLTASKIPVLNQSRISYEKTYKDEPGLMLTPILTIQDKASIILMPIQGKFVQNKSTSILADHDGLVYFSLN